MHPPADLAEFARVVARWRQEAAHVRGRTEAAVRESLRRMSDSMEGLAESQELLERSGALLGWGAGMGKCERPGT